jgi:hypothetical protein
MTMSQIPASLIIKKTYNLKSNFRIPLNYNPVRTICRTRVKLAVKVKTFSNRIRTHQTKIFKNNKKKPSPSKRNKNRPQKNNKSHPTILKFLKTKIRDLNPDKIKKEMLKRVDQQRIKNLKNLKIKKRRKIKQIKVKNKVKIENRVKSTLNYFICNVRSRGLVLLAFSF